MKKILPILFLVGFALNGHAQAGKISAGDIKHLKEYEDTLALCAFLVVNDSLPEERFGTCKKLITTLVQALKTENSFNYKFNRLKSISIQYPQDSSFRVFTWQLYVDVDDYRYYGAIQMNSSKLQLFPLVDRSAEVEAEEYDLLTPEKWYGSVYYNLRQFDTPEGDKYLLFGYDGFSFFNRRKIVDVLSFKDGKPIFGAPVFVQADSLGNEITVRNRLVMEFSAEASFKLNYDETWGLIIYDHLMTMAGGYGQGPTQVPDGTYEGYKLKNGQWLWVEKYWTETMEEAPRPEPVLDARGQQDVFGKEKKSKKKGK
ncbi:MAG: hypothetical protein K9J37_01515 [Saprospiraceae bacterium]|nr:hypothetical protein [Saprospiraceae bacterium]MCF8248554.1 hypothetical protein [Saprospiraceae bacterium]MCF8280279.1 hypothetical protein [Bacteroidales bacterium]MCF8310288.1 hypothetical protein [Saprospiraceae bacterium]MCF8439273.1 hypothetical protein [Saprospiraceae bacterium]